MKPCKKFFFICLGCGGGLFFLSMPSAETKPDSAYSLIGVYSLLEIQDAEIVTMFVRELSRHELEQVVYFNIADDAYGSWHLLLKRIREWKPDEMAGIANRLDYLKSQRYFEFAAAIRIAALDHYNEIMQAELIEALGRVYFDKPVKIPPGTVVDFVGIMNSCFQGKIRFYCDDCDSFKDLEYPGISVPKGLSLRVCLELYLSRIRTDYYVTPDGRVVITKFAQAKNAFPNAVSQ